jgi:hypothetical protein
MKIPDNIRPFVIPAAWLASAALTFGLGRLTSYVDAGPESHTAGSRSSGGKGDSGFGFSMDGLQGAEGGLIGASGPGHTLAELTNGKPVGDWLKQLMKQDDEIVRMTGFLMLLERVNTPDEFKEALAAAGGNGRGGRGGMGGGDTREYSMLLQKWTKMDPKAAMAFVEGQQGNGGARMGGMATVLQTWTKSNPQEAIAWAKASAAAAAATAGAEGEGGGGGNGFGRMGGNWAMTAVIGQLARTDVGQALQLAQSETGNQRGMLTNTLVNQLITQRGEDGARDAIMGVSDEALRNSMIRQLAGRMANDDPQKALSWVNSLPAGTAKSAALADAVSEWAQQDAAAAATYMTTLPTGPETDAPRARFALSVVRTDPAGAVAWANSITNPETRTNSLTQVVGAWMRTDAPAAQQWVQSSSLPQETKAALLAPQANQGRGQGFTRGGGNTGAPAAAAPGQGGGRNQGQGGGRRGGGGGGGG